MTEISTYDLDAALSSFCAAYQAVYGIVGHASQEPASSLDAPARPTPPGSQGTLFLSAHLDKLSLMK
jgi:hypothetical protein